MTWALKHVTLPIIKSMFVGRNECQKWKECNEIKKTTYFEPHNVERSVKFYGGLKLCEIKEIYIE